MDQLPVNPQDFVSTQVLPKDEAGDGRKSATTNGEEESEPFWEEEKGGVERKQIFVSNPVPVQEDFSMDILAKEDDRKRQDKEVDMMSKILAQLKQEHNLAKSVKSDNTEVPVGLWDAAVCKKDPAPIKKKALTTLQGFMLCLYRR